MKYHIGTGEHRQRTNQTGGTEYKTLCGTWVRDCNIKSFRRDGPCDCQKCIEKAQTIINTIAAISG